MKGWASVTPNTNGDIVPLEEARSVPTFNKKSERGGEQVLPTPFWTHFDWILPEKGREDPVGQLLVVRQRREAVAPPPLLLVWSLDPGGQKNVEGHRQGLREEAPESPVSPAAISQTGPN